MSFLRRLFGKPAAEPVSVVEKSVITAEPPAPVAPPTDVNTPIITDQAVQAAIDAAATAPVRLADGVTRPLPPDPINIYQPQKGHILFGQTSDRGMVRNNNQDAALAFFFTSASEDERPDFGLFIVADGMGGHQLGEKASALTSRVIATNVLQKIYQPLLLDDTDTADADRPTIAEALTAAVKQANEKVIKQVPEGGTTVTAVVVMGNMAHIAHVGDSRAYLITREEVEQMTRDHSLVQRLIELGTITPEEALDHPQRNVLYRAIGQTPDLEVDTMTRRLPPGTHILVCSDGLWGWASEREILDIINNTPDPQEACDKLVALANSHGGHDNITALLFRMPGNQS